MLTNNKIRQCYHEANLVVDLLASFAHSIEAEEQIFEEALAFLLLSLEKDMNIYDTCSYLATSTVTDGHSLVIKAR